MTWHIVEDFKTTLVVPVFSVYAYQKHRIQLNSNEVETMCQKLAHNATAKTACDGPCSTYNPVVRPVGISESGD